MGCAEPIPFVVVESIIEEPKPRGSGDFPGRTWAMNPHQTGRAWPKLHRITLALLSELYLEREGEIEDRLQEFERVFYKPDERIFEELIYCILTVQSSARSAWKAVIRLKRKGLLFRGRAKEVERCLRGVRFARTKANRIIKARRSFSSGSEIDIKARLPVDPQSARRFLAHEVEGMGYKEASHFLRNIGYRGLAILDRHVLKGLADLRVIDDVPKSLSERKYLAIERLYIGLAQKLGIAPEALDLLLWSAKTGEVLK